MSAPIDSTAVAAALNELSAELPDTRRCVAVVRRVGADRFSPVKGATTNMKLLGKGSRKDDGWAQWLPIGPNVAPYDSRSVLASTMPPPR